MKKNLKLIENWRQEARYIVDPAQSFTAREIVILDLLSKQAKLSHRQGVEDSIKAVKTMRIYPSNKEMEAVRIGAILNIQSLINQDNES